MASVPLSVTTNYLHQTDDGCIRVEAKPHILIYQIPRSYVENLMNDPALKAPGVYFLVKNSGPSIYVGQADSHDDGSGILKRMLGKHSEGIDDWDVGYALTSGTANYLQATELNWLEQYFYEKAKSTGRYKVLNNIKPHANEPDYNTKLIVSPFIDSALFILPRQLQCYAFEDLNSDIVPIRANIGGLVGKQLFLSSKKAGVSAMGVLTGYKSIYIYPSSAISAESKLGKQKTVVSYEQLRNDLEKTGVIENGQFIKGYEFSSTSTAASVILGTSSSGNQLWKDRDGHTLAELRGDTTAEKTEKGATSDSAVDKTKLVENTDKMTPPSATDVLLYLRHDGYDALATGILHKDKSITIEVNSKISKESKLHNQKGCASLHQQREGLCSDGTIKKRKFAKKYTFKSPSTAASIILGTSTSGNEAWRTENGTKLGEYLKSGEDKLKKLHMTARKSDAYGIPGPKGDFIVLKGSRIAPDFTESFKKKKLDKVLDILVNQGIITDGVFTCDWTFSSISAAASIVGGSSYNGNVTWREEE